jgi:formamidopyrimidine-DNA glycosylase
MEKMGWGSFGYNQGYSPEQPIAYDHSLHVGQYGMQCQYCHNQIERSGKANIPALSTCMNCHLVVRNKPGTNEESPEIKKLVDAYNNGTSIEWVKVHMLPDHVQFNHSAHLAKGVACQTCHGPIETMKKVSQFSNLSMGWCVNCHRQPEYKAPINCSTCHH